MIRKLSLLFILGVGLLSCEATPQNSDGTIKTPSSKDFISSADFEQLASTNLGPNGDAYLQVVLDKKRNVTCYFASYQRFYASTPVNSSIWCMKNDLATEK